MSACPYGDATCPCQDGDPCHYEDHGDTKAMPPPALGVSASEGITARDRPAGGASGKPPIVKQTLGRLPGRMVVRLPRRKK